MNLATRKLTLILIAAVLGFASLRSYGQDAKLQLGNLDKLSQKAARVTDVTLDGSLLQFAVNLIEKADDNDKDVEQLQSIIKNLRAFTSRALSSMKPANTAKPTLMPYAPS